MPAPQAQGSAHAAFLGGKYYVVFSDNDSTMGTDIHLRSMDTSFVADQGVSMSIGINGVNGAGDPNIQSNPAIAAGPGNKLFVAWQDDNANGVIYGRTVTPGTPPTLGAQNQISQGTSNTKVALAATPNGWVAVWQSGDDIKLKTIASDGTPGGKEITVNNATAGLQDHPSVAALADGRFAVVYAEHNMANGIDIVMQRYDVSGNQVAGDQAARVNNVVNDGDQTLPVIGSVAAAGGSFAIAWLDSGAGNSRSDIRGRFAGGTSGFLPNNVDGQDQEFQVSLAAGKTRTNPVVVSGGAAGNVIFGWEDKSSTGAGIIGRFFPAPPAQ